MFSFKSGISALALVLLTSMTSAETEEAKPKETKKKKEPPKFVTVKDQGFYIGEEPYQFIGANMWYGTHLANGSTKAGMRIRVVKEARRLSQLGITNVRLLGASEQSATTDNILPVMLNSNGELDERMLLGLDYALKTLRKNKIRAVVYLNNFWEWSGGMSAYVSWSEQGDKKKIPDSKTEPEEFANYAAQFYSNKEAVEKYNNYIKQIVGRTSRSTRMAYKDDRTIMAWELSNAPRPGHGKAGEANLAAYNEWIKNTTKLIKSIDPNHLVTIGSEGTKGCLDQEACVINAHKDTGVDYMTFHMRPDEWGWFDKENPEKTSAETLKKAGDYIQQHVKLAKQLNMPLVLEDFALSRDGGNFSKRSSTKYRDQFFTFVYSKVEESIKNKGPLVGSNFWSWGGMGEPHHKDGKWRAGDYYHTGDTPLELQGINSVFKSDLSTLNVIGKHRHTLFGKGEEVAKSKPYAPPRNTTSNAAHSH